jgi:hypothetical protein
MISERRSAEIAPLDLGRITIPPVILGILEKFRVDRLSGNVLINIQRGKIVGARAEEIVDIKGNSSR